MDWTGKHSLEIEQGYYFEFTSAHTSRRLVARDSHRGGPLNSKGAFSSVQSSSIVAMCATTRMGRASSEMNGGRKGRNGAQRNGADGRI